MVPLTCPHCEDGHPRQISLASFDKTHKPPTSTARARQESSTRTRFPEPTGQGNVEAQRGYALFPRLHSSSPRPQPGRTLPCPRPCLRVIYFVSFLLCGHQRNGDYY